MTPGALPCSRPNPDASYSVHDATAKIWLQPPELARIQGFNPNERRRIVAIVEDHREQRKEGTDTS